MKHLIISSSHFENHSRSDYGFEVTQLIQASKNYFDSHTLVYPPFVQHHFHQNLKSSKVFLEGKNISDSSALIVRSTTNCEEATRLLAMNLYANNCELLDPLERFHGATATKSFMTLKGLKDQTIPSTFIAFTAEAARQLLPILTAENLYPVVGKPSNGKHGRDVKLLKSPRAATNYIREFFNTYNEKSTGLIFQKYIEIEKEFRVLLLDGECLGMVEKMAAPKSIARNAKMGSKFVAASNDMVEQYAVKYTSKKGLLGADIAVNLNNDCFLLESNRSPQWKAFETATGVCVAEKIMEVLEKRSLVNSELF